MIDLQDAPSIHDFDTALDRVWAASGPAIQRIEADFDPAQGAPVFTVNGTYTTRGWTEWTQGFQYGSALLHFDATGDTGFLDLGRRKTVNLMGSHVTHFGVHDHGFNNVSTYGTLLRLMEEGRIADSDWERHFYEMALCSSAAVQARRWTALPAEAEGGAMPVAERGFIHSFNGPHSLFSDTIRTLRVLALGHQLGHVVMGEADARISLLGRLLSHAQATARYNVFYGEGRDRYDRRGRVAHEGIFNVTDGCYRCPSTQQGYSPFTTWTRGLAWVMCGFAEQLEFLAALDDGALASHADPKQVEALMRRAACAACDFYIETTPPGGVPYWDTGAPGLDALDDPPSEAADPYNPYEPVDSSAAAIAAQGLLRLGRYLRDAGDSDDGDSGDGDSGDGDSGDGDRYWRAGLRVADTLFDEPYLSTDPDHHGLLLHSVYHWPNGWDHVPEDQSVPCGEATMWGDYHARELALYLERARLDEAPYYTFFLAPARD